MSKEQKRRYHAMVNEISGHLDRHVDTWPRFMNMMRAYLSPAAVGRCKNIFEVFDILLKEGHISYGNYDVVREAVDGIDVNVVEIIDEYTDEESSSVDERNGDRSTNRSKQTSTTNEERASRSQSQQGVHIHIGDIGKNANVTIGDSNISTSGQANTGQRRRTRSQSIEEDSPAQKRKKQDV